MIISGKVLKPFNVILMGTAGIGKSTWAASAPKPLFIGAEENDELNCDRLPQVKSFDEFEEQLKWIVKEKPKHETLVIDTIDSIEKLLHKKIVSEDSKSSGSMAKAHGGYGKGYEAAESSMLRVRDEYLKKARDVMGMNIIILSHCKKVTASDTILGLQYDTYEMTLHQKVQNVFCDWVSCVFFANYVTRQVDDANSNRVFALGDGERVLLTEKRPGHLGKNRFNLPYEMPLDFNEFYARFKSFYEAGEKVSAEDMKIKALGLCENIKDENLKVKVIDSINKSGSDPKKLERIIKRTEEIVGAH